MLLTHFNAFQQLSLFSQSLKKQKREVSLYLEICHNMDVLLQFFTQDYVLLNSLSDLPGFCLQTV